MIIDSSALMSIVNDEPGADRLLGTAAGATCRMSVATWLEVARVAYRRYGRGRGSPARLNVGDCFAYALSVTAGEPLLFTGDDFGHTDVASALR